jgi:hypothetical protein
VATKTQHLCTALLCLAPLIAWGDEPMRRVTLYDGLVTLEVPTSWNEIPTETLEFYSLRSAEASGGRMAEVYQLGFRPDDPELDFALPQILIQIRESGREPYGQFLRLPASDLLGEMSDDVTSEHAGPLLRGVRLDEVAFDRDRFALHLANSLELQLEGRAIVTSVSYLTERGYFILHCYALEAQMDQTAPLFSHVVDSIEFADELRYRPRLADRWPPHPSTVAFTAAGITAAILVIMVIATRRQRA